MTSLFHTEDLTVQFGGLRACDEISLDVHDGELLGLIGPNGAGKTTFINAITGFVPMKGSVVFDGSEITGLRPIGSRTAASPARGNPLSSSTISPFGRIWRWRQPD